MNSMSQYIKSYFTYETEATDGGQQHPLQPEAGVADGHEDRGGVGNGTSRNFTMP